MKLDGFHFTEHGWVQSYGSRYVRPPIIYGDVHFTEPMTVKEFKYAQSLTQKPVKGMLTGEPTEPRFLAGPEQRAAQTADAEIGLQGPSPSSTGPSRARTSPARRSPTSWRWPCARRWRH